MALGAGKITLLHREQREIGECGGDIWMLVAIQAPHHGQRLFEQRFGLVVLVVVLEHRRQIIDRLGERRVRSRTAQLALHRNGVLHQRNCVL